MSGRLSRPPHPELFARLYAPSMAHAREEVLPFLLAIDAAHVVMLAECGLLPAHTASALLAVNREMEARLACPPPPDRDDAGRAAAAADGADLGDLFDVPERHRGLYLVYERAYITRLGEAAGGAAHLARSRNDINAAVTRLRLRRALAATLDRAGGLLDAIAAAAAAHGGMVMSGFTHLQPAQPTTLGHYLAGVACELLRSTELLDRAYDSVNRSPMGAAAGYGTSFAIDRQRVASLLGFGEVIDSSLDAVASRDYIVHVLQPLALLGVTLTRLAADLQAWSSAAYGFLAWPDDFVSTSSIMPQKRNAFVLEHVRGGAAQAIGALTASLTGMKSVPFANSVEMSAEATAPVWPALAAIDRACDLMRLLLAHVEPRPARARAFAIASDTCMTAVTDWLVAEHGLAFRTAHDLVGGVLRDRGDTPLTPADFGTRLERGLAAATGRAHTIAAPTLARLLDPDACVREAAYGGGPSPASVRAQMASIGARRDALRAAAAMRRTAVAEASARLRAAADEIVGLDGIREAGRNESSDVHD